MDKSLNQSIIEIRVELQNSKLKKSGKNKFAGFDYFELSDILPRLNELMAEYGINDRFSIEDGEAVLELSKDYKFSKEEGVAVLELSKGKEKNVYKIPFILFDTPINSKGIKTMQDIQYLGSLNTYYKRYLYLNAFGITDGEVIDAMNNNEVQSPSKNATPQQIEIILSHYKDEKLQELLKFYKIDKLEDMELRTASALCKKIKEAKDGISTENK